MKSYKFLSHTADIRLQLEASSLKELFTVAILGMNEIMKKGGCSVCQHTIVKKIELESVDPTTLLIDFMSEILTYSLEEQALFCEFDFVQLDDKHLIATIKGCLVPEFDIDVKAVTYHEAEIKKNEKGYWETIVIFDI